MPKKKYESKYHIRKDGMHEAKRSIGGKVVHFYGKTDREIDRKILEYKGIVERGRLFIEVAEEFYNEHWPTLSPNTLRGYNPAYKRAETHFGATPIKTIKPLDVQRFIIDFSVGGKARKTVATQLLLCNLIFAHAVVHGDIEYNPCAAVKIPKGLTKTYREPATQDEESAIKSAGDVWLFPFLILYTGLRKGEALALTFGDIDRKSSVIHVTKSVCHINNVPVIKAPKTEKGIRDVPILAPLLTRLPKGQKDKYLFSVDDGVSPLRETQYKRLLDDFRESTGVTCSAHQLRHSYATMLEECGVDYKIRQDILGHAQLSTTMDVYTHLRDGKIQEAVAALNKYLSEDSNGNLLRIK